MARFDDTFKLAASRTYYVATSGNDSNDGLAVGSPFLTIQKAVDVVAGLDIGSYTVTIQIADGDYTSQGLITLKPPKGIGNVLIQGNTSTVSNVVLNRVELKISHTLNSFAITGMRFSTSSAQTAIYVAYQSILQVGKVDFYLYTASTGMAAWFGGIIRTYNNEQISVTKQSTYSINYLAYAANGSIILENLTFLFVSTPVFAAVFFAETPGYIDVVLATLSGAYTGRTYKAAYNSVILKTDITFYNPYLLSFRVLTNTNTPALSVYDVGATVYSSGFGLTLPQQSEVAFDVNAQIQFVNNSGSAATITRGTGCTMYNTATATDSATISVPARAVATFLTEGSSVWYVTVSA